jgi:hypothetical protein
VSGVAAAKDHGRDDNGGHHGPHHHHGQHHNRHIEMRESGTISSFDASCSVASLVTGTLVGDAELRFEGGSAVFEEIELGNHSLGGSQVYLAFSQSVPTPASTSSGGSSS